MALDKDRLKTNIVNRIESEYGISFTPAQRTQAEKIWNIVADEIINEFKTNAKLNFTANDFKVDAGSFVVGATPVTGQGQNATITGKGSIT